MRLGCKQNPPEWPLGGRKPVPPCPDFSLRLFLGGAVLALALGCPSNPGSKGAAASVAAAPQPPARVVAPAPASFPSPPAARDKARPPPVAPRPVRKAAPPAAAAKPPTAAVPGAVPMPPTTEAAPAPSVPVNSAPPVPVVDEDRQPRPLPLSPRRTAQPAPGPLSRVLILRAYGAQMAVSTPTSGGLRLTAGGPSVVLGLHAVWTLPKGLRLRPRLDYTVICIGRPSRAFPATPPCVRVRTRRFVWIELSPI